MESGFAVLAVAVSLAAVLAAVVGGWEVSPRLAIASRYCQLRIEAHPEMIGSGREYDLTRRYYLASGWRGVLAFGPLTVIALRIVGSDFGWGYSAAVMAGSSILALVVWLVTRAGVWRELFGKLDIARQTSGEARRDELLIEAQATDPELTGAVPSAWY